MNLFVWLDVNILMIASEESSCQQQLYICLYSKICDSIYFVLFFFTLPVAYHPFNKFTDDNSILNSIIFIFPYSSSFDDYVFFIHNNNFEFILF